MAYLFTSESVSEGHPDKVADQISDAILDNFLITDPEAKVACETLVTTGLTVLSGEVKSASNIDHQRIVREVINKIGYNRSEYKFDGGSCGIVSALHEQSEDINRGVVETVKGALDQGAGDQGMMFGYATNETESYLPLPLYLSHLILIELAKIRKEGYKMTYLRPDAKSQVTVEYGDDNRPCKIVAIVVSTQHDHFGKDEEMHDRISHDVKEILIPSIKDRLRPELAALFTDDITYHINPTGKFVIGGPHGDTGLTGRKIIVDTYGGKGAHGGGAFSGKDPSKVDRSAAYATRHIAKNMVAAGICDEVLVQVAYAIGVAEPMGLFVSTYGTKNVNLTDAQIADKLKSIFDMRPAAIIERLKLKNPIYLETAAYGHMGRTPEIKTITLRPNGQSVSKEVETFTWEKLDFVDELKAAFNL